MTERKVLNIRDFKKELEKLASKIKPDKIFGDEAARKFLLSEVDNTLARTSKEVLRGRDVEGAELRPYSPGYIKLIKAGLARSGNHTKARSQTRTNLLISGELLTSRKSRFQKGMAEGYFDGDHSSDKGKMTNANLAAKLYKMGFTNWHAFGEKDIKRIQAAFKKLIDSAVSKIGR